MSTPTGLLATSGLELLTWSTPNGAILPHHPLQPATPTNPEVVFHPTGYKISIFLEELHAAYGVAYTWQAIDLTRGVQKEAWYTALHPNGKIPCLVDHERGGRAIMEGQAILQYLCRAYDRDARFHFRDDPERAECEQWMGFAQSHLGPQAGEANFYYRFTTHRDLFALHRAMTKLEASYAVLDKHLTHRTYLVGETFSVADLANYAIVAVAPVSGVDLARFPHVARWAAAIERRPAVARGQAVPSRIPMMGPAYGELMERDPAFRAGEEGLKNVLEEARGEFGGVVLPPG